MDSDLGLSSSVDPLKTTVHPLRVLVDHGDGRTPTYQLDAQADVIGCGPAAGGSPFDGPAVAVAVTVVEPVHPSGASKAIAFVVAPTVDRHGLAGWIPAALGHVDGHTGAQFEPDPNC